MQDIVVLQQPGLPYPGWTLPQIKFWSVRAWKLYRTAKADAIEALMAGISGAIDSKANAQVTSSIRELRG